MFPIASSAVAEHVRERSRFRAPPMICDNGMRPARTAAPPASQTLDLNTTQRLRSFRDF
jgi:hypothetical protein